jgi:hypothetical protein
MPNNKNPVIASILIIPIFIIVFINPSCTSKKKSDDVKQTASDKATVIDTAKKQAPEKETETITQTRPAKKVPDISKDKQVFFDKHQLEVLGRTIIMTAQGLLKVEDLKGKKYEITLYQDTSLILETVNYSTFQNDLILIYQLNAGGDGWSEVVRVNLDVRKVIWKTRFGGFNLSPAILQDNFLYGSTLGYIGKVDLNNGGIVWEKQDLWEKYKVNSFTGIGLTKDTVVFVGKVYEQENRRRMIAKNLVLKYNKVTGEQL